MQECPECGYMKVGYDGFCERCETRTVKMPTVRKPHYHNRSLDDLRDDKAHLSGVPLKLPPDEPRIAVSHGDYMEFLRRMQTHPMTEGEVADLVIRRFDRVAAGTLSPDETVYEVRELRKLSEAWISEAQEIRIRALVNRHASRRAAAVSTETTRDTS